MRNEGLFEGAYCARENALDISFWKEPDARGASEVYPETKDVGGRLPGYARLQEKRKEERENYERNTIRVVAA